MRAHRVFCTFSQVIQTKLQDFILVVPAGEALRAPEFPFFFRAQQARGFFDG